MSQKEIEARFNVAVPELKAIIERRRNSWHVTSIMEWADVSSILLTRLYQKFHLYDPEQPLDRWANTVISNAINNLLRNNVFRTARPCISATPYGANCSYNLGGDLCGWTPSGKQCSQCSFFKAWEQKKQFKHAISVPLSIENHIDESHSLQNDFVDIDKAKEVIDEKIIVKLDREEAKIYRFLYIKGMSMEEVGKKLGYKKQKNSDIPGYLILRSAISKFKILAKEIIDEEGLVH